MTVLFVSVLPSVLTFAPVAAWVGGLHTSAQHCGAGLWTRGTCSLVVCITYENMSSGSCLNRGFGD